jgi:hypothetical protein
MSKVGNFFKGVGNGLKDFGEGVISGMTGGLLFGPKGGGNTQAVDTMINASLNSMMLSSAGKVQSGMSDGKKLFTQDQDDKDWQEKKERHRHS